MSNQKGYIGAVVAAFFVVLTIIALVAFPVYYVKGTERTETLDVKKTERVQDQNGNGAKYLFYTEQGTYENTDSLLNGKFNSSDLYGEVEGGKTYDCKVYGWRIPFFSQYPNVVSCKESK